MKTYTGGVLLALFAALQVAPCASASPQRPQADAAGKQAGLPWAYGFSASAPPEPAPGACGRRGARACGGSGAKRSG